MVSFVPTQASAKAPEVHATWTLALDTRGSENPRYISSLIEGSYDNAAQFAAADAALKRPPAAGFPYPWIDLQHARFVRIEARSIGCDVVYLEWRSGGPDGPISRQRIWSFRQDGNDIRMDFFTLRDPALFAGADATHPGFAGLTLDDLIGYGPACGLRVAPREDGFVASINPADCQLTARSGRRMGIEARVEVSPGRIRYEEAGILADGTYAFRVPGGLPYHFDALRPPPKR
jgi:hypothetical protein